MIGLLKAKILLSTSISLLFSINEFSVECTITSSVVHPMVIELNCFSRQFIFLSLSDGMEGFLIRVVLYQNVHIYSSTEN